MRFLPILALTGASLVQASPFDQVTVWFDNLKNQVGNAVSNPIDAFADAVAGAVVQPLSMQNWKTRIWPKPDHEQEWMVYMTGGNKSCFGRCGHTNRVWNESVPLLKALPQPAGKPMLKLGSIDCESNEILCTTWSVGMPAIWHFHTPATNLDPEAATDIRIIRLNTTTAKVEDITSIPSVSTSRYLDYTPYEGVLHPINGTLQKFGLSMPFGFALWILGAVPSWLMMLVISFASRSIMSKRMGDGPGLGGPAPAQGQAQAQPAAAAGKTSPAGGKKGNKKR